MTIPMFETFSVRSVTLANRIVVSPMCMYSAHDGTPDDFHLVHLGARAMGGAGLVLAEMTAVSRTGRISPGCAGLWTDAHAEAWRRIVVFVHQNSTAKLGLQLGHAGRKGSTCRGWDGYDKPLAAGNWPIVSASPLPWGEDSQVPAELDEPGMEKVVADFEAAALRAQRAGFDWLELHAAHGYLLSSFISPLTNLRTDAYGGSLDNRLRFPLQVLLAVRRAWPGPLSVKISAQDWVPEGLSLEDAVTIARRMKDSGADVITVSAGQTTSAARPPHGRLFQVPLARQVRAGAGVPAMAVGAITAWQDANALLAAGDADLCALARPHLVDAAWTLRAAAEQGVDAPWPRPYLAGKLQLERHLAKQRSAA
jgi:anthraniloyl-CoA monooxygenase